MSATTQVTDFNDLYTDLQNRAREQTGIAATENQAKRYINSALHDMHIGQAEKFPWTERTDILFTVPKYTTGTVAISNSSGSLGGTSTAWSTNTKKGGKIVIDGGTEVYTVLAVNNDTSITLETIFGKTTVIGASYVYFEDEYALDANFLRPVDQQSFDEGFSIDLVGRTEFRRRYPRNRIPGKPRVATIIDKPFVATSTGSITAYADPGSGRTTVTSASHGLNDGQNVKITGTTSYNGDFDIADVISSQFSILLTFVADDATGTWLAESVRQRRIRFAPPPDTAELIPYAYVTKNLAVTKDGVEQENLEADSDEPIIPVRYRHVIVLHALYHWYRDKKDDVRSQEARAEYTSAMVGVISDNEIGSAHAQIRPRIGTYRRRARSPWRGGSGRYDLNGRFDRFEDR